MTTTLQTLIAARDALEPFAHKGAPFSDGTEIAQRYGDFEFLSTTVKIGELRKAHAALAALRDAIQKEEGDSVLLDFLNKQGMGHDPRAWTVWAYTTDVRSAIRQNMTSTCKSESRQANASEGRT